MLRIDAEPVARAADEEDKVLAEGEQAVEGQDADGEFGEDADASQTLGGDITDISNSAAVKYLEKLVQTGQLTEQRCLTLRAPPDVFSLRGSSVAELAATWQDGAPKAKVREAVPDGTQNLRE